MTEIEFSPAGFVSHMQAFLEAIPDGERRIVAIAGAPASGKTSLAAKLEHRLNGTEPGGCAVLPMDGFHYDDELLGPRGWQARKGAPHTFDVGGLSATLRRLRANDEAAVAVPRFDRSIEIARAGAILIGRSVRLVIAEGNYLLVQDPPWDSLAPIFDRTALIVIDEVEMERRNRQRWVDSDMDETAIRAKLEDNDLPNGRLVYARSAEPDYIIRNQEHSP
ncbi:MAG: nucleoside/nucleotide kinase family protein [Chloroflexota bacterium]